MGSRWHKAGQEAKWTTIAGQNVERDANHTATACKSGYLARHGIKKRSSAAQPGFRGTAVMDSSRKFELASLDYFMELIYDAVNLK